MNYKCEKYKAIYLHKYVTTYKIDNLINILKFFIAQIIFIALKVKCIVLFNFLE